MEEEKTIARGFVWNSLAQVGSRFLGFIFTIIITRLFVQEDIGAFFYVFNIMGVLYTFTDLGLVNSFQRYIPFLFGQRNMKNLKRLIPFSYALGIGMTFVFSASVFFLSEDISEVMGHPEISPIFQIMSIWLLVKELDDLNRSLLNGRRRLRDAAVIEFAQNLFKLVLTVVMVTVFGNDVAILAGAFLLSYVLILPLGYWFAHNELGNLKEITINKGFTLGEEIVEENISPTMDNADPGKSQNMLDFAKEIMVFGISVTLLLSIYSFPQYLEKIMLGYLLPHGLNDVSLYTIALALATITTIFPSAIYIGYYPIVAELFGKKDYEKISQMTAVSLKWVIMVTLPLAVVMIVFGHDLLAVFYGNSYTAGGTALGILVLALLIKIMSKTMTYVIMAMRRIDLEINVAVITTVANLGFDLVLIPLIGLTGAAIAALLSSLVAAIALWMYSRNLFKINLPQQWPRLLVYGIAIGLALLLLNGLLPLRQHMDYQFPIPFISGQLELAITQKIIKLVILGLVVSLAYASFFVLLLISSDIGEDEFEIISGLMTRLRIPVWVRDMILSFLRNFPAFIASNK